MSARRQARAARAAQQQPGGPAPGPATFDLEHWLARLPASYDSTAPWATPAEHEQHRRTRAYLLYLGARRRGEV